MKRDGATGKGNDQVRFELDHGLAAGRRRGAGRV